MVDRLLDALLPWRCVVCGLESQGSGICPVCKDAMPWNTRPCRGCGLPLPEADLVCGNCLSRPPVFDSAFSPLLFNFPVDRLVHKFKFQRDLAAGRVLGEILFEQVLASKIPQPDLLVPVPMHRLRLIHRGLNPAFELAGLLGKPLGIQVAAHDLQRRRHTPAQSGLDAVSRRKNLKDAFRWRGDALDGKRIALVDDVLTTGSTLTECTKVLKRAGANNVAAWTASRAVTA